MGPAEELERERNEQDELVFIDILNEAIQEYADAVAAFALAAEGITDTGENPRDVDLTRARLRSLLTLLPPMTAPDATRISLIFPPGDEPGTNYARLFAGSPDGILVVDTKGRYRDVNPVTCQLLGYSRAEFLVGNPNLVPPGAAWFADARAAFLAAGHWRGDIELCHKDGGLVPIQTWSVFIESPEGPLHVAFLRDIRERKAAEAEQATIQLMAHEVLERSSEGFCALDRSWRFTFVNAAAARILGRPQASLVGRSVWEEFPHAVGTPFFASSRQTMREGIATSVEIDYAPARTRITARAYPSPGGIAVFLTQADLPSSTN